MSQLDPQIFKKMNYSTGRHCAVCDERVAAELAHILPCRHILHWNCLAHYNDCLDNPLISPTEPQSTPKKRKRRPSSLPESDAHPQYDEAAPNQPFCPTCITIPPPFGCPFDCPEMHAESSFLEQFRIAACTERFSGAIVEFSSGQRKKKKLCKRRILQHMRSSHARLRCGNCSEIVLSQHLIAHSMRCTSVELILCPTEGCNAEIPFTLFTRASKTPAILLEHPLHACRALHACSSCTEVYLTSAELLEHGISGSCKQTTQNHARPRRSTRAAATRGRVIVGILAYAEAAAEQCSDDDEESDMESDNATDPRSALRSPLD